MLFDEIRYFFYITNRIDYRARRDRGSGQSAVRSGERDRATQERVNAHAHARADDLLEATGPYMVIEFAGLRI